MGIRNCDERFAAEARLAASGAQTYRDFRREASRRHDRWMGAFKERGSDVAHELATARQATLSEIAELNSERKAVLESDKGRHEFANYLVSLRGMEENQASLEKLASGIHKHEKQRVN